MEEYNHEFADHYYHTYTQLEKTGGLWAVRAGRNLAKPNYSIGPRIIFYYSLHIVLEGEVILDCGAYKVNLKAGDLFCLFPHKTYRYYIGRAEKSLQLAWLAFDGKQARAVVERMGLFEEIPYARGIADSEAVSAVNTVLGAMQNQNENSDLTLLGNMYALFGLLAVKEKQQQKEQPLDPSFWMGRCLDYIHLHINEGITIADVVKLANVSRSHFSKKFRQKLGVSPLNYMQSLRMKHAVELLMQTSLDITAIAISLGYSDLYSFTRSFKRHYGCSPSNYRKKPVSE